MSEQDLARAAHASWGESLGMTMEDIYPQRFQRKTNLRKFFGEGKGSKYHVVFKDNNPIAAQGVTDYDEFYGGAGAWSVAFALGRKPGYVRRWLSKLRSEAYGLPKDSWKNMVGDALNLYKDKPFVVVAANPALIPTWHQLDFTEFTGNEPYLSQEVKEKLRNIPEQVMVRDGYGLFSHVNKAAFQKAWQVYIKR